MARLDLDAILRTARRTRLAETDLKPIFPVGHLGDGIVSVGRHVRLRTVAIPGDAILAWHYGDNLLILLRNDEMPRYVAVLYSERKPGQWEIDRDLWLDDDEIGKTLGRGFRRRSHEDIVRKMLERMD